MGTEGRSPLSCGVGSEWKRMEREGERRQERNRKVVGRRYLRVVCRNAIRSDFDTFRYPIPANISPIDTNLVRVLRATSPLVIN